MKIKDFYSDFKWCVDHDFQVYIKPYYPHYRIAVRKGGITCQGKDFFVDEFGFEHTSIEQVGEVRYKTVEDATEKMYEVYEYLKKTRK